MPHSAQKVSERRRCGQCADVRSGDTGGFPPHSTFVSEGQLFFNELIVVVAQNLSCLCVSVCVDLLAWISAR